MRRTYYLGLPAAILLSSMAVAAPSPLPTMSVADFLGKAYSPAALFNMGKLKRVGEAAVVAFYAQAAPAGRPRNACPPPEDQIKIGNMEFLHFLEAVPEPQRASTSVAQAVTVALNKRHPCR